MHFPWWSEALSFRLAATRSLRSGAREKTALRSEDSASWLNDRRTIVDLARAHFPRLKYTYVYRKVKTQGGAAVAAPPVAGGLRPPESIPAPDDSQGFFRPPLPGSQSVTAGLFSRWLGVQKVPVTSRTLP